MAFSVTSLAALVPKLVLLEILEIATDVALSSSVPPPKITLPLVP